MTVRRGRDGDAGKYCSQQDDDGSITVDKSGLVGSDTAIFTLTGGPEGGQSIISGHR
ncbi:MAG: hypothetical protein U5N58_06695 [Actinomycetota bacterium]|nr:hypothetical protein [Actinomycetota bacterium]